MKMLACHVETGLSEVVVGPLLGEMPLGSNQ